MDQVKAAAQLLGSIGGKRNTPKQNEARAQNGKRGGRPKKLKIVLAEPERSGNITANE